MATFFLLFFILICSESTQAQNKESRVILTAGLTWRSTAMNFFNFKSLSPSGIRIPGIYEYERSVQGVSLNLGVQYQLTPRLKIEYYPNLRYDFVKYNRHFIGMKLNPFNSVIGTDSVKDYRSEELKVFLVDHNFNFLIDGKKFDYGVGMTIVAKDKVIEYDLNATQKAFFSIEFRTYNAFIVVPIKKVINLEIKALYIPSGFPYNIREKYIMYSLRAYYKFNFKRKKKAG